MRLLRRTRGETILAVLVAISVLGLCGLAQAGTVSTPGFNASVTATVSPTNLPTKGTVPVTLTITATGTRPESSTNPVPNPEYPMHSVGVRLDRQITVDTEGLPTCWTSDLKGVTPTGARQKCGDALIGSGGEEVTALVSAGEPATFNANWDLLFFNTWDNGHPAVLMYRSYTRIPQGIAWPIGTGRNLRIEDVGGKENRHPHGLIPHSHRQDLALQRRATQLPQRELRHRHVEEPDHVGVG